MWGYCGRMPLGDDLTDKIEVCGFNVTLNTNSIAYTLSVTAFCRVLSSAL